MAKQAHRVRGLTRPKIPGKDDLLIFNLRTDQFPADFFRWDIKVTKGTDVRRHVFLPAAHSDKGLRMVEFIILVFAERVRSAGPIAPPHQVNKIGFFW